MDKRTILWETRVERIVSKKCDSCSRAIPKDGYYQWRTNNDPVIYSVFCPDCAQVIDDLDTKKY